MFLDSDFKYDLDKYMQRISQLKKHTNAIVDLLLHHFPLKTNNYLTDSYCLSLDDIVRL